MATQSKTADGASTTILALVNAIPESERISYLMDLLQGGQLTVETKAALEVKLYEALGKQNISLL